MLKSKVVRVKHVIINIKLFKKSVINKQYNDNVNYKENTNNNQKVFVPKRQLTSTCKKNNFQRPIHNIYHIV